MINIRQKGARGEREIANALNEIIESVLIEQQWPDHVIDNAKKCVQRNQNQSAVGGCDLTNVFGLAVEVKRQEALSINTWWKQCVASAERNGELPVLIYRQNRKNWKVILNAQIDLPKLDNSDSAVTSIRAEIDYEDFKRWFKNWVRRKLLSGELPRV